MPKRFSGRYSRIPHRGSGVSGNHFKGSMFLKSGHKEKRRWGLELGHLWVGWWACPSWAVTPLCVGVGGAFGGQGSGEPRNVCPYPEAGLPPVSFRAQAQGTADCQASASCHTRMTVTCAARRLAVGCVQT